MSQNLKQYWNSRSKRWVLIDCNKSGGIIDMQKEKFDDVPTSKGSKAKNPEPENKPDPVVEKDKDKSDSESGLFDWLGG